jgi:hypothetical protein
VKRILTRLILLVAAALLAAGCSDEDPVTPDPDPEPAPVATTPDSLMSLHRIALEETDAGLYEELLGSDFHLQLSPFEGDFGDPPTDHLTRGEAVTAMANMCAGQPVTNWRGDVVPGVAGFTIHEWVRADDWAPLPAADGVAVPPPYEMRRAVWSLRMFVERGTSYPLLSVAGQYAVTVGRLSGEDPDQPWFLVGIQPLEPVKSENFGWVGVNLLYLTNQAPQAVLTVAEQPGESWPEFTFDPAGSADTDSGLPPLPFRYRIASDPFMPPENWTDWSSGPLVWTFESEGERTVTLEVRDRWGATDRADRTVTVSRDWLPFPGSPDQLMANFRSAQEDRDLAEHRRLLHPDFRMMLQQETVDQFPDLGETIDRVEELRIHERMFSGDDLTDPTGAFVPGVQAVEFLTFGPLADWAVTPPDDPMPGALFAPYQVKFNFSRGNQYSQLRTEGVVLFYATSRDSLHEGTIRQFYQMVGQKDLTAPKAVEGATYGTIKAIYR